MSYECLAGIGWFVFWVGVSLGFALGIIIGGAAK